MIRPICAICKREMTCTKNEVAVIHFTDNSINKGIDALCYGDMWDCNICECSVVIGLGQQILGCDMTVNMTARVLQNPYVEVKF